MTRSVPVIRHLERQGSEASGILLQLLCLPRTVADKLIVKQSSPSLGHCCFLSCKLTDKRCPSPLFSLTFR